MPDPEQTSAPLAATATPGGTPWEFAGWGRAVRIDDLRDERRARQRRPQDKLGVWKATALCGNDITSSVLYVSALAAAQAGPLAPVVLLAVSAVLYLYRAIYAEVGSALYMNGGTYTLLLNATSKRLAAAAACFTLLSYLATAVISANAAAEYAEAVIPGFPVLLGTVGLLLAFAVLNVVGITESATVAVAIFVTHLAMLSVLALASGWLVVQSPELLAANWVVPKGPDLWNALFFGFAAAMLGISGFESSSNFIEEQEPGVFPKTLRNMWLSVSIFNPLMSFLALGLLPLDQIRDVPPDLLATMGGISVGPLFASLVSADAVLVLSGAVLTSYVGVTGLVRRMTVDACLPAFLLRTNQWRGTNHWIIFAFFVLATSILLITQGRIDTLAAVYGLSFLSVMSLFGLGNLLLKYNRARLPRDVRASTARVVAGLLLVLVALVGNIVRDAGDLAIFASYLALALGAVMLMFERVRILKLGLTVSRWVTDLVSRANEQFNAHVVERIRSINETSVIYFTRQDDLTVLNRAAVYVRKNELTNWLRVVHVYEDEDDIPKRLGVELRTLAEFHPELRIDFLLVRGHFGPDLVDQLSKRLNVPKNFMFIGTPGERFAHRIEHLGGVRVIL
jgi:amino acid transporter